MSVTTFGNTTITPVAAQAPYGAVTRDQVMESARIARECHNAIKCLRPETQHARYLKQVLQVNRQRVKQGFALPSYVVVSYQGQQAQCLNTHAAILKTWKDLRDRVRAVIRERRRKMREEPSRHWAGFMREFQGENMGRGRLTTEENYWGNTLLTRRCGVHLEENTIRLAYVNKLRRHLFNSKAPIATDSRRWISVEIECVLGKSTDAFCDEVLKAGAAKWVCVKSDSSIRKNDGDVTGTTCEVVISAPQSEIEEAIRRVCVALAACDAYVNKSCGLHIHLDMRNFDRATAFSNLVAGQRVLRLLVPEYRIKNRYCKPVGRRDWPINGDRYKAVNHVAWQRHRTVEVRLFAGCVDASKIVGYIKLCAAMAYANGAVKRAPSSAKGWQKANPEAIDNALMQWVKDEARNVEAINEAERAATANNNQASLPGMQ